MADSVTAGVTVTGGIEHSTLIEWCNEADEATKDSRATAERCRDYYDSKQWTPEEVRKLKKQKQAALVFNRIKPKMDALMGMEKAAKTTAKAYPRTPKHEDSAEASTEAVRFVLQDNFFDQIRSAVWEFLLIEGTGGCDVNVEPATEGGYKVTLKPIFWDRILYDPHARQKHFQDARYLGQVVWMDYDQAVAENPGKKEMLDTMMSGSETYDDKPRWMDTKRRRVKIVELYYRGAKGDVYYARFTRGGFLDGPKISPFENEEGETEWCYEFASLFVSREGDRYGATMQLLDVQDDINKRRSKAQHLMSVRQTFGTKGAVEDVNKARAELAKPDGYVEFSYGKFGEDFGILPTGDMAQAQFKLLEHAVMEIDAVGANSALMGKDTTAVSGVALAERRSAGQTEVGPMFDVLRYWQLRVYRKVWNRIRQYWKSEKWIRVTDDENNLRWVGLNKPVTAGEQMLKKAQEAGAEPAQLQALRQQIAADPAMQQVVATENEVADLDVDIIMSEVPDVLTAQIEDFQTLGEMVKSGFPMPPEAVIEASPLHNKDKIIKAMKAAPQIPKEIQEKVAKVEEENVALKEENQALKSDQQTEIAKVQLKAAAERADLALKAEKQAAETRLMRERAEAEIAVKTMLANAEMALDERRIAHAEQMAEREMALKERQAAAAAAQAARDSERKSSVTQE